MLKNINPEQTGKNSPQKPNLTLREQEIFDLLLAGSIPKDIAQALNIGYNTVLSYQKTLYSKLGVHSINELLTKYSIMNEADKQTTTKKTKIKLKLATPKFLVFTGIAVALFLLVFLLLFSPWKKETAAVFKQLHTFKDDMGSYINIASKIEYINKNYYTAYTISGKLFPNVYSNTGIAFFPDSSTQEAMRKMTSFSFTVLGDGNSYYTAITTSDTSQKADFNHYRTLFYTKKDEITTVTVKLNELYQSPYFGKQVPFVKDNIENFQIEAYSTGEFNLKVWDIKFIR